MIKKHWKEFTAIAVLLALIIAIGIVAGVRENKEQKELKLVKNTIAELYEGQQYIMKIEKADYVEYGGIDHGYFAHVLTTAGVRYLVVVAFTVDGELIVLWW